MRRRALLALVGSLAAGSGCTGTSDDPGVDRTVTPAPVPTPTDSPTSSGGVRITAATVQPGVVVPATDYLSVDDTAGQYLVVEVAGDVPERSAVEFRFSGASYTPEEYSNGLYRDDSDGTTYGEDGGPLAFGLPETGDGTDAELAWDDGSWAPAAQIVERLEDPLPPLAVSIDGSGTADTESDPQITVSVTNEGDGAGRYVLALNRQGPRIASTPVARVAGELSPGAGESHRFDAVRPVGESATSYTVAVPRQREQLRHVISPS